MWKAFKLFLLISIAAFLLVIIIPPFLYDVKRLKTENPTTTALIEYRKKQWEKLGIKVKLFHSFVPLSQISPFLIKAVLIAEDDKFYQHEGFDLEGIKVAIEKNLKKRKLKYGGSTISQQLAKNLFLGPKKTIIRKLQEALLTLRIEKTLSKRRILELYLNYAEWGHGIFGIEAASLFYFQKHAKDLTPEESALLASVLPNPIKYNPTRPTKYITNRAEKILYIMRLRNIIPREYEEPSTANSDPLIQNASDSLEKGAQDTLKGNPAQ